MGVVPILANDHRLPAKRRSDVLKYVRQNGHAAVTHLCVLFQVSADTIRRDLDSLAAAGHLARTHGGALIRDREEQDHEPLANRQSTHIHAKNRIARHVVGLIEDGETLFINGGTTTLAVARELNTRTGLTVLTNNLLIPAIVRPQAAWDLYVLGGRYHAGSQVTTGTTGFSSALSVSTDTAIIGVGGVAADTGFSLSLFEDAALIERMLIGSKRVVIVADSSKFGRRHLVSVVPFGRTVILVTDAQPPPEIAASLQSAGMSVHVIPQ